MKIWYARVSTIDQNPNLQIDALKEAGCEKIFIEKASGARGDRPKLKEALEYLREWDILVVWKLSRLARSLSQIIKTAKLLEERWLSLKVLTARFDTSTPEWKLFFHITASFDEFQREIIVENTRAWLASAHKRGRRWWRPKVFTEAMMKKAKALLKDVINYPFTGDVIDALGVWKTTFYHHISAEEVRKLREEWERMLERGEY